MTQLAAPAVRMAATIPANERPKSDQHLRGRAASELIAVEGATVAGQFEEFVATRGGELTRFAYVLCGDHHLAEDLVQEVLARMLPRWTRIERDVQYPDAYVRTAVVREFLSWRRRRASTETATADPPEPRVPLPDAAARHAQRDELWQALAALPRSHRAVLVLRFFEDLPDDEIATVLGCKKTTVRGHAMRGLARLREILPNPDQRTCPTTSAVAP
jgi:RNA polymerase sigma-70 factor (sigma-E family)